MVASVNAQSIRNLDKDAATHRPIEENRAPVFTRKVVDPSQKSDAKVPRTFGAPGMQRARAADSLHRVPAGAGIKDGMPGVLGDIAGQTWNSAVEFAGASSRWAARQAPTGEQFRRGALSATAGAMYGGLASRFLNGISDDRMSSDYPLATHALIGAGAAIGVGISWLNLAAPVAPAAPEDLAYIAG